MMHTAAPRDASHPMHQPRPMAGNATPAQLGRIERILTDNDLHAGAYDRLWAQLEAARINERTPGDGTPMGKQHASDCITWLQAHGYWPGRAASAPARSPYPQVTPGYYATRNAATGEIDFWRVSTRGSSTYRKVQRVLGGHVDTTVRAATARAALEAIEAAGEAEAGMLYATKLRRCMHCTLTLTDDASRALGKGEDCADARGQGEQWRALDRQFRAAAKAAQAVTA